MPGMMDWQKLIRALAAGLLVLLFTFSPMTTQPSLAIRKGRAIAPESKQAAQASGKLAETAPPEVIQELRQDLEKYQPQVKIVNPRPNEVLTDDRVAVQFQVKDLPIFKDKKLGLGPHLHVLLDNRTYQAVYDISQPLVFDNLEPGTHTLRAFASRPWHESFKNEGAYAQTTFHIFTKTQENSPDPNLPLLTYSRPQGSYGAEPILLDFYLTNAPLHLVAREDKKDDIADWRIRCTVNGRSFLLDQWQPVYLKGFKPGKNWVQLEFLDENGDRVPNVFNNTARIIIYEPGGQDSLAKLVRGEFSIDEARSIVDPDYKPAPKPLPTPAPETIEAPVAKPAPERVPAPVPPAPTVKTTPSPAPSISPTLVSPVPIPAPEPDVKVPQVKESPAPIPAPAKVAPPEVRPTPLPAPQVVPDAGGQESETEQLEKLPASETGEPAAKTESPKPSPQKTVTNFLNRFRPPARSTKPIAPQPSPSPSIAPSPQPTTTPEAIKEREPAPAPAQRESFPDVRVTPQPIAPPKPTVPSKGVESLQPTLVPKPEVTRNPIVAPKAGETPEPAVPKSPVPAKAGETPNGIAAPKSTVKLIPSQPSSAKPSPSESVKPQVAPEVKSQTSTSGAEEATSAQPAATAKPRLSSQPKPEGSKALTEIQGKATELKSKFTSRFNQLRDRFRRPAPSEGTKPTPKLSESEPTAVPVPDVPTEIKTPPTLTAPAPPEPVSPIGPG